MDPIDWRPCPVISIKKESDKKTKYILNYEELQRLVAPVIDLEVAIIPIVGPSRMGKSFILNYMIRYLSDQKSIDWVGSGDQPLEGNHCLI